MLDWTEQKRSDVGNHMTYFNQLECLIFDDIASCIDKIDFKMALLFLE